MAKRQTSAKSLNAISGAIFVSVGLLLLFANLDQVATHGHNPFTTPAPSFGVILDLGLAGLRAVQTYLFEPSSFQAGLHQVLVSCWPLALVLLGAALLYNEIYKRLQGARLRDNVPTTGAGQ